MSKVTVIDVSFVLLYVYIVYTNSLVPNLQIIVETVCKCFIECLHLNAENVALGCFLDSLFIGLVFCNYLWVSDMLQISGLNQWLFEDLLSSILLNWFFTKLKQLQISLSMINFALSIEINLRFDSASHRSLVSSSCL